MKFVRHGRRLTAAGMQVAVVWRSFDGEKTRLRAWLSADAGAHFSLRELATAREENDHPRLLVTPSEIRVLWRIAKEIHVLPVLP